MKKNPPTKTSILYVGKAEKNIGGRIYVHLGYYHAGIHGLQLVSWAKQINLKLKLHIYSFDMKMCGYISPLELPLARKLNPLIGKQ